MVDLPAGMRNNNPLNIKFRSKASYPGIVGPSVNRDQGDPQNVYDSAASGWAHGYSLLRKKYDGGKTTPDAIIAGNMGWTPGNHAAAANVARTMGIGPNDDIGFRDPARAQKFMRALVTQEQGDASRAYRDEDILNGIRMASGMAGGSSGAVAQAPQAKPNIPMIAAMGGDVGNAPVVKPLGQIQPGYEGPQPDVPTPPTRPTSFPAPNAPMPPTRPQFRTPMPPMAPNAPPMAYAMGQSPALPQPNDQAPMAYAMGQSGNPLDDAGNAIGQAFGAPGGAPQENPLAQSSQPSSGLGGFLANLGKNHTFAKLGAAIASMSNPQQAAALMSMAKDDPEENDWQNTVQNGQLIRINKKTGAVEASDIPGFKRDTSDDWSTSIHNGQVIRVNRKTGESSATAVPGYKDNDATDSYDEDTLKGVGQDYLINGNDRALAAFKEPTRIKALQLARDQFEKDSGRKWDSADSAIQRGAYKAFLANSTKYGQMLAPTQAAHDRLQADIQIAKERVADLPAELNANNLPMNKFMQMTAEQLQNAGYGKLAKAREALYNVERGYSSVQANGMRGGDTVASQKRAEALINSAMTPEVLLGEVGKDGKRSGGLLDFMGESSHRILQGVKGGQETLRNEFRQGIHNASSPMERTAASEDAEIDKRIGGGQQAAPQQSPQAPQAAPSQKGLPEGAKQAPDGNYYVQQNGKWYKVVHH